MVADLLAERPEPLVLDYHNITRPELYGGWEPATARRARPRPWRSWPTGPPGRPGPGRQPYNEADLVAAGCPAHGGGPGPGGPRPPGGGARPPGGRPRLAAGEAAGGADWLFVGRLVPSKAPARAGQGPVGLPPPLRPRGPAAPGRARPRPSATWPPCGPSSPISGLAEAVRVAGEVSDAALAAHFRCGRRLRLAVGPRGLRGPPARGHGRRGAGGGPGPRGAWPAPSATAGLVLGADRAAATWPPPSTGCCPTPTLRRRTWWPPGHRPGWPSTRSTGRRRAAVAAMAPVAGPRRPARWSGLGRRGPARDAGPGRGIR